MKHGYAFGDHIKTEKIKRRHYEEDPKPLRLRWYLLPTLIILAGMVLTLNLFSVQVIQGKYYQQLSDSNRIRTQVIPAPRGIIFDRNENPLVYNIPGYQLLDALITNTDKLNIIIQCNRQDGFPIEVRLYARFVKY